MKRNEIPKGTTAALVLKIISRSDCYGYDIIKQISALSEKNLNLKQGTLYPILHTLEKEKLIESYWSEDQGKRKRKYYKITKVGLASLEKRQQEWQGFRNTIDQIFAVAQISTQEA
jgi:DNA-binding PadR family transcriptional regulator